MEDALNILVINHEIATLILIIVAVNLGLIIVSMILNILNFIRIQKTITHVVRLEKQIMERFDLSYDKSSFENLVMFDFMKGLDMDKLAKQAANAEKEMGK